MAWTNGASGKLPRLLFRIYVFVIPRSAQECCFLSYFNVRSVAGYSTCTFRTVHRCNGTEAHQRSPPDLHRIFSSQCTGYLNR